MSEEFAFILALCIVILYVVTLSVVYAVGYYLLNRKFKYINEIFKNYLEATKNESSDTNA